MVTGKSTKDTVKTIAQGRPDDLAEPVVTPPAFCLQAGHGCGQHPAFPAPSSFRGRCLQRLGRETRRENAGAYPLGCLTFESGIASEAACGHASGEAKRHCEPTGWREAPPDDRLREAIQNVGTGRSWIASSLRS